MPDLISKVVVVGGGSAGWLVACRLAAEYLGTVRRVEVTLVESPDVPTIGVGEGTWPSMRDSLQQIGLAEDELLAHCDASFKQGTKFFDWRGSGSGDDSYMHPFSLPEQYAQINLAGYWLDADSPVPFAEFVCPQAAVINAGLAPKQEQTPAFAFNVNYAYHFDAGAFAERLQGHGVGALGIRHLRGNVVGVDSDGDSGDIRALRMDDGRELAGDIFVDCTGSRALLLGGHYGVADRPVDKYLFNDRAIAVQAPYRDERAPIAATTNATARAGGWVWDISLQSRRGIGFVYSSGHLSEDAAMAELQDYLRGDGQIAEPQSLPCRTIAFAPGHKERFWVNNCLAVGLSAGFVEPLEASALVLVEQSATFLASQLPRDKSLMAAVARRFNRKMSYHWERIVEFLKLHYCLSARDDSDYWRDQRRADSCPDSLHHKMQLWQQQPPWYDDAPRVDELFPSASYQYVLFGMGFRPRYPLAGNAFEKGRQQADRALHRVAQNARRLVDGLPDLRTLIAARRQQFLHGERQA